MTPTKFLRPIVPLVKGWALSFLGWGMVGFVLGMNFVRNTGVPWTQALHASMRDQLPWALLTPLLFRFAMRYPINRATWKRRFAAHILTCAVTVWGIHQWKMLVDPGPGPHRPLTPISDKDFDRHRQRPFGPPPPAWDFFHFASVEIPIYIMIVSVAHTLRFHRRAEIGAAQLASARLQALQAQLRPHFLFNTLNTIAGLTHKAPDKADSVLIMLSELLRLSLETSGETHVSLQRELDFTEKYLAIMQIRYYDRVCYQFQIAQDALNASVPTLLLQPLVENAIKHAIEPNPGGGKIDIRACRDADFLGLSVSDTGPGISKSEALREGFGLSSTRARLHELYGEQGFLEIDNESGFTVKIKIPFRTTA
ncbi:MAG TPA: histidine kinase [Candidatus Udaeobacter sp.]|jgi:two-component system LytT family sensor kinase|nr:histidine kinase [Candidatus Udaeobacter sp.]